MILSSQTFVVEKESQGLRLDKFLASKMQELSRSRLQTLIEEGFVKINQDISKDRSLKVKENQQIEITLPPLIEARPSPQDIPLNILFEDQDIIVINKPPGMVVHPAPGNFEGTLVNALLSHCGKSLSGINGFKRPGIVHRLDKETSGLLIAAKNDKAHQSLAQQLANREMSRSYIALVWGLPLPLEGTIEGPIGRDPHHRQRMTIRVGGKFARTHYKVLKAFGKTVSLVECRLETGRTHQIRVHLASKGRSLIGDPLYGKLPKALPSLLNAYLKDQWPKGRQALHAKEITFIHPVSLEKQTFSIELPEDMRNLIDVLSSLN